MEVFLIVLVMIAEAGAAFFLFVIEPRRKIYDYDPLDPRRANENSTSAWLAPVIREARLEHYCFSK